MISGLVQSAVRASTGSFSSVALMQTRTKMKTSKTIAKRFIKNAEGLKRKQAGRNHGNGGFSSRSLAHLDTWVQVTNKGGHLKKLERYV